MNGRCYFKVANHLFEVRCDSEFFGNVTALMGNYAPFALGDVECSREERPIFTLEVFVVSEEIRFTEEIRQIDEGQEIVCGKTAEGFPVFEYYVGGVKAGTQVCSRDFSECKVYFSKGPGEQNVTKSEFLKKFALNNSAMVQYALATANKNTALFHSSVVVLEDKGYMFLGKSGTGKSTHARMWLSRFADAELLNDDNPVVRLEDDGVWVYGSPWSGKTPCYKNRRVKVAGIVDLSQAPENKIRPIKGIEAYMALLVSISGMRWDKKIADGLHATENRLAQETRMFHLDCLPNENAAEVCYAAF